MDQKDKHGIRDDGRKPGAHSQDGRGQQGQRDRSRDSESAGQGRQIESGGQHQAGQHQAGQQQVGQRQMPGQQQAGQERRQDSGQQGSGPGHKPYQGGGDHDKDRQR